MSLIMKLNAMIVVACLILRFLIKLRFPQNCPISIIVSSRIPFLGDFENSHDINMSSGGARKGLEGATVPLLEASSPSVGGNLVK